MSEAGQILTVPLTAKEISLLEQLLADFEADFPKGDDLPDVLLKTRQEYHNLHNKMRGFVVALEYRRQASNAP